MGRPSKVEKGNAPSEPVVFTLGRLFPVGLEVDSPPAVEGLDIWVGTGEALRFGDVTDAPRSLEMEEKVEGIRRPVLDDFGYIGNVGAWCITGGSAGGFRTPFAMCTISSLSFRGLSRLAGSEKFLINPLAWMVGLSCFFD